MSEASRQRRLFLQNVLEELRSRHGNPEDWPLPDWLDHHPGDNASWGPVGSLARHSLSPEQYEKIRAWDREAAALERQRAGRAAPAAPEATPSDTQPQQAVEPEPPQNRVLSASEAMSHLDRYGETPLFACPRCGEESGKASVPIDRWHCTACDAWGKASALGSPDILPGTEVQRV